MTLTQRAFRVCTILTLVLSSFASTASAFEGRSDDRDLSRGRFTRRLHAVPSVLRPDSVQSEARARGLMIRFLRRRANSAQLIEGLPVALAVRGSTVRGETLQDGSLLVDCEAGAPVTGQAILKDARFEIGGPAGLYSVSFEAACGTTTTLLFEPASDAGQALGIWSIARLAERKLADSVNMSFWKRPVRFEWPADGDYYSFGTVSITRGDYWDVVGHELGHAIYAMANVGSFGGGMHKIDECYSEALALSEGWASYFSAWLSIDLRDPDAKFEFMVPRRSPIRIETVPADVCAGHKNEWRVTAFIWDLIDLNRDSEQMEEPFARVWNALLGSYSRSAADLAIALQKAGFSPDLLDLVWELNFRTKRPAR